LPAASLLSIKNGAATRTSYWRLEDRPDYDESEAVLAERYRALILDAVDLRMKRAQRTAFTLSGGMDSSSVLASAVRLTGTKQHAISSTYVDKTYDESAEIQSMLAPTVSEWHRVEVDVPDVHGLVARMIAVHDEPVATATWLSHFLLCESASSKGFDSLFGGLGSDELNAGEYEHFWYYFADLKAAGDSERLQQAIAGWVELHDHPIFHKSAAIVDATLPRVVDESIPGRCLPDRARIDRYASVLNRDYFDLLAFEPVMDTPFRSYLKNRTYQDLVRETVPCCLRAEDRQTAAFGLQNHLPFLDYRLAELMFRVSGTLKYDRGVTKRLLREAMRGILPEETRTRSKKTGWNAPAHQWFSGKGADTLRDLVGSATFRSRELYNVAEVRRLIDEHDAIITNGLVKDNHMMFFWQLVNLETWLSTGVTLR
jgi:asparagine synthase (glutamine-hydrolysing)